MKRLANVPMTETDLSSLRMTHLKLYQREGTDITLGVKEEAPELRPVAGGIGPGCDRTREWISEIIRSLNSLFGEGLSEGDHINRMGDLLAIGEQARRDPTVR
ncbi:hypothetical protein [endosymbiont of Ridgeia piscesae]|uniref:Uncharacterized protein n=2 Tax=endosymbiont of Ridgeia piscesae TaxID=54398 RepID=A0A0T5Z5C0_9GAMM|nr:hypothetical protein [endosymbiont of Ridgeia piscesae]KRT57678.1 hypothetical protein Ga0076813_12035 [endosymbiont of Ridgeia piscesae]